MTDWPVCYVDYLRLKNHTIAPCNVILRVTEKKTLGVDSIWIKYVENC